MGRVEVVLNAVVRAARQLLGNVSPLVAQLLMEIKNFLFFVSIYRILIDVRVQMIVPPTPIRSY